MRRILSAGCCFWVFSFASVTTALPKKERAAVNEDTFLKTSRSNFPDLNKVCVRNEVVYYRGENFNTGNPCEICVCNPPEFECVRKTCEPIKPGCTNIYVADKCCPQSICECKFKGMNYSNGEKVKMPDPCHICYCQGGDIKCASVVCFRRSDCRPIYKEGTCCPKYENCPLETTNNESPESTSIVRSDFQSFESGHSLGPEPRKKLFAAWVPTLQIEEITAPYSGRPEDFGSRKPNPEVGATRADSTSNQQTEENSTPMEIFSKSAENLQENLLQVPTDKPPDGETSAISSVSPYEVAEVKTPFILEAASNSEEVEFSKAGEKSPVYLDFSAPKRPDVLFSSMDPTTDLANNSVTVNP